MKKSKYSHKKDFILDATCKSFKKEEYISLYDPNLSSFFSSPKRIKLLKFQKLILPSGEINEKLCKMRITTPYKTSKQEKLKANFQDTLEMKSRTPDYSKLPKIQYRTQTVNKIHPITSNEFREMLNKRREILKNI